MAVNKKTDFGKINITNEAIAAIVADAAMECYGVVGITNKDSITNKILKRNDLTRGIVIKNNKVSIDVSLYVVVAFNVKVTEVLRMIQKKVKYVVEKTLEIKVNEVNVYVQDLKKVS